MGVDEIIFVLKDFLSELIQLHLRYKRQLEYDKSRSKD